MKKAWKIISGVLVWMLVAVAVVMMVFTIVSVNTFDRNDRAIFGHKMYIVLSDSMSATDFSAGALVVVKEVPPATLQAGDIITFVSQGTDSYGQTMTHKIRSLTTTPEGEPGFITYGTTTGIDDESIVTYPYVQGKYVFAIPGVGSFFTFMKTPLGYMVCILLPFMLLILYQGVNCVRIFRRYKKEQMQELQDEKDAIAAERRKTEEMMEQMLRLKEEMMGRSAPTPQPGQTPEAAPQPEQKTEAVDVDAMMAELAALRAQVAQQEKPAEQAEESENRN
ncbi:MAG: signal peptidase I [Oscillospiraceae bacterium]|nr:signal peptidase I [Oscillospiraceae bacterium]MBR3849394.1 signal peptidase I [Oscillospiraceae bacterium]